MLKKQRFTVFENCGHEAQLPDYVLINIVKKAFKNEKKWTFGSQLYLNEKSTLCFELQSAIYCSGGGGGDVLFHGATTKHLLKAF